MPMRDATECRTKRDTRLRKPKRSAVVEEGLEQEVALVRAFYANRLVVEALENRRRAQVGLKGGLRSSRQGGSVAAILRRWFVGKQTMDKAAKVTIKLQDSLADEQLIAHHTPLVGTAALLEMAASADLEQRQLVQVIEAPHQAGYALLTLGVKMHKRGRPPKAGTRPRIVLPKYYIHHSVVAACREWTGGYEARNADAARLVVATNAWSAIGSAPYSTYRL